ncbi:hypothetical protein EMIT0P12_10503 [Pseudomonas sp. IT-P12]
MHQPLKLSVEFHILRIAWILLERINPLPERFDLLFCEADAD